MTGTTCATGCTRTTNGSQLLCRQHLWELEQALSPPPKSQFGIPALLDELKTTLTRQDRLGHGEKGNKPTKAAEQPLPVNLNASDRLDELRVFLVGWVRDIAETHGHDLPPDSLRAMSRWLLSRLDIIATHPAVDDIYSEITSAVAHAWRACDRPATKTRFMVGPCPEEVEGGACQGEVWAYIPTSEEKRATMACTACGTTWETHQWLRAGRRILDVKNSADRAERLLRAIFGEAS